MRAEVLTACPRPGLRHGVPGGFEDQAARKPDCAAGGAVANGVESRLAANPLG
ncbi:hypothetical protein AB0F91_32380 [Amycolatopsis sp. NPDC023774]|uniref:hypothetical protein n=1 Tax=Amycolatopsis sp. NPDC023774 TaxID=3155015 RepID=UPI00340C875B